MMDREDSFLWGAASAATQIEGAYQEDGKCLSIWDNAGNRVRNKQTCHVACDHYHRYKEDVALMKEIGLNSYRFSINPCRIMTGEGQINEKGLDFYRDLIRELKKNDIEPLVTLYHWDLPQWVQDKGGWKNDAIQEWYLEYVKYVVEALKDDVKYWFTFNEPSMFIAMSYATGFHAPFQKDIFTLCSHHLRNMLMAHGRAVKLIREITDENTKVGLAMAAMTYIPDSLSEKDIAKAAAYSFDSLAGEIANSMYMDPLILGHPARIMKRALSEDDLKIIAQPLDFIGINVYQPLNVVIRRKRYKAQSKPKNCLEWPVDERCLYWTIRQYYERYRLPILISENGVAYHDEISEDGQCHDPERIDFLKKFISSMEKAIDDGYPVIGYQHWSVMDNFEWCEGYDPRFGLIHIDYETQKRTLKDSAYYYKQIIAGKGKIL